MTDQAWARAPAIVAMAILVVVVGCAPVAAPIATGRTSGAAAPGSDPGAPVLLSLGWSHSCVVTLAGGVRCWGAGGNGQLGDGAGRSQVSPVDVAGLNNEIVSIAAGGGHTCSVTHRGAVKCWGWNSEGSLGNGTFTESNLPVDVSGLSSGVAAITAGGSHTCALTTAGGVLCWGANDVGQLGDGTTTNQNRPVPVIGLESGVLGIAAGSGYTCALIASGVKCWGADGVGSQDSAPQNVKGLDDAAKLAAGFGAPCLVTTRGAVRCWVIFDYVREHRHLREGVTALAMGGGHDCALTTAGGVKCWGYNSVGQLGTGSVEDARFERPVDVVGLSSAVRAIAAGLKHSCALLVDERVLCWGGNDAGGLGHGLTAPSATPVEATRR